jgi:uncharacterized protein YndB with AHSA1/START domain
MAEAFVMSRVLDAPRDMVWRCFTDPEHLQQWWGPKGYKVLSSKMELRPGGTYHYGMQTPNGQTMWGKFVYLEIVPQERLVFINSFSDEGGGVTRHPGNEKWPLEMRSTFTFEDMPDGRTKFTVSWTPHNADDDERKTFDSNRENMRAGWTGTMEQLETYLARTN